MFNGFETALSEEWNRDTGDNGQVVNDIKTNIWFSNSNSETVYSAYNHS